MAWPMVSNIEISFYVCRSIQHRVNVCWGEQLCAILSHPGFWHSLWMTVWYTALVVAGQHRARAGGGDVFNREFRLRKTARSLVILSYVTPSISLVFAWKYMFNNGYGIVNYLGVDLCISMSRHRCGSIIRAVALCCGAVRHLALLPVCLYLVSGDLQTIDKSLYEAAEMDGANAWQRFRIVTLPAIMPVAGDGGDTAHHLDVLHVRGCLFADDQGRYSVYISTKPPLPLMI
ncbi:carbohydrate ABC transporter permease [Escherichia coli]